MCVCVWKKSGSSRTSMEKIINKIDSTRMEWLMELPIGFASIVSWSQQHIADVVRDVCPTSRVCRRTYAYRCIHSAMAEEEKSTNHLFTKFQMFDQSTSSAWKYQFENQISIYIGVKMAFAMKRAPNFDTGSPLAAHGVQQIESGSLWFIQIEYFFEREIKRMQTLARDHLNNSQVCCSPHSLHSTLVRSFVDFAIAMHWQQQHTLFQSNIICTTCERWINILAKVQWICVDSVSVCVCARVSLYEPFACKRQ